MFDWATREIQRLKTKQWSQLLHMSILWIGITCPALPRHACSHRSVTSLFQCSSSSVGLNFIDVVRSTRRFEVGFPSFMPMDRVPETRGGIVVESNRTTDDWTLSDQWNRLFYHRFIIYRNDLIHVQCHHWYGNNICKILQLGFVGDSCRELIWVEYI